MYWPVAEKPGLGASRGGTPRGVQLKAGEAHDAGGGSAVSFGRFSHASLGRRVVAECPSYTLWAVRDAVVQDLSPLFARLCSHTGRPSNPPE